MKALIHISNLFCRNALAKLNNEFKTDEHLGRTIGCAIERHLFVMRFGLLILRARKQVSCRGSGYQTRVGSPEVR